MAAVKTKQNPVPPPPKNNNIYIWGGRGGEEPHKSNPLPAEKRKGQLAPFANPGPRQFRAGVERAPIFTAAGGTFGGGCSWELEVSVWFWSIKMDVA